MKDTETCAIVDGHQISHIDHALSLSFEDIKHLVGVSEYDLLCLIDFMLLFMYFLDDEVSYYLLQDVIRNYILCP